MAYIRIIRPINLVIVFIIQIGIYWTYVYRYTLNAALGIELSFLLSLSTAIVAACGYIINDYYDVEIDLKNKPDKVIITKEISRIRSLSYYSILNGLGLLISIYIALRTDNLPLLPLYPLAQLLLYIYAKRLKLAGLFGNIIVAFMTTFVCLIIIIAERKFLNSHPQALYSIITLATFAFLSNLTREIIKDTEDIAGDKLKGSRSLPIISGIVTTKYLCSGLLILIISLLIIFILWKKVDARSLLVLIPILFSISILLKIFSANKKADYTKISSQLKFLMLIGFSILIVNSI
jgi:4-hydroxybenzoate polyprenyltransferase